MSLNNLIVFTPSSEPETVFFKRLRQDLLHKNINLLIVTTSFSSGNNNQYDFSLDFQIRLNTDLYFKKKIYNKVSPTQADIPSEYILLLQKWKGAKANFSSIRFRRTSKDIKKILKIFDPFYCLVWGDNRPFSLLALDVVKNTGIPFCRIDRGFIPNSYRLFKEANSENILLGLNSFPSILVEQKTINELINYSLNIKSVYFTENEVSRGDISKEKYVLFLAGNDIDIGIINGGRFKNKVLNSFGSSLDAYNFIKNYLKKYNIDCFIRLHPNSPDAKKTNIEGKLEDLIQNALLVIGTATGTLFNAVMLNKPVICVGNYALNGTIPFEQTDDINKLIPLIKYYISQGKVLKSEERLHKLSVYFQCNLFGISTPKNNNININLNPLVNYLLEQNSQAKPINDNYFNLKKSFLRIKESFFVITNKLFFLIIVKTRIYKFYGNT